MYGRALKNQYEINSKVITTTNNINTAQILDAVDIVYYLESG